MLLEFDLIYKLTNSQILGGTWDNISPRIVSLYNTSVSPSVRKKCDKTIEGKPCN